MRIGLIAAALLVAAGCEAPAKRMTVPMAGASYTLDFTEQAYDAQTHRLHVPLTIAVGAPQSSVALFDGEPCTVLIDTQVYARAELSDLESRPPAVEISTGPPDPVEPFGGTFAHTGQTYQVLTWSPPTGCMGAPMDLGANRLAMTLEIDMPEGFTFGVTPIDVEVTVWRLEFIGPDEDGAWLPIRRFHSWDFWLGPDETDR
ncbi:MAG: hypothetical protein ACYTFO_05910 [Planctomycetota bacterium]|jgi:hypothetical protein